MITERLPKPQYEPETKEEPVVKTVTEKHIQQSPSPRLSSVNSRPVAQRRELPMPAISEDQRDDEVLIAGKKLPAPFKPRSSQAKLRNKLGLHHRHENQNRYS